MAGRLGVSAIDRSDSAPLFGAMAAASYAFSLRAKWVQDIPARQDFDLGSEFRLPRFDLLPVLEPGPVPIGAALPSLLLAAAASIDALLICVQRANGARTAVRDAANEHARVALADRVRESHDHARRTELLTADIAETFHGVPKLLAKASAERPPEDHERPFDELVSPHVRARLVAAGLDEQLLGFSLPVEPSHIEAAKPKPEDDAMQRAGPTAAALGRALGESVREVVLSP